MFPSRSLRFCTLAAIPILSLSLASCGGGGSNLPSPLPIATLAPPPRYVSQTTESFDNQQFTLVNGQIFTFNLQTYAGETRISGSGTIAGFGPPGSPQPGRLGFEGQRTGPREFEAQLDASLGFLKARLATATDPGSFTYLTRDSSESGVIVPTAQAQPTPTPPPSAQTAQVQVTISASSDSNYRQTPLDNGGIERTSATTLSGGLTGSTSSTGTSTYLSFDDLPLRVGAQLNGATGRPIYLSNSEYRGENRNYQARSGTIEVVAIEGDKVTIRFNDLIYVPAPPFNSTPNPATGTLRLNGTLTGRF